MKQSFKFDEKTGVVVQENGHTAIDSKPQETQQPQQPQSAGMSSVMPKRSTSNLRQVEEDIIQFRERSDLTIFQIVDEQTNTPLGYISGYALDFKFNLSEMRSTERVEQFLDGVKKMFREIILRQAFSGGK